MKKIITTVLALVLILGLAAASGCQQTSTSASDGKVEGMILTNGTVLVLSSGHSYGFGKGDLLVVHGSDGGDTFPVGSRVRYTLEDAIMESWPVQGTATAAEKVADRAGWQTVSFDAALQVGMHIPGNTHLIDVRTVGEYTDGHVSGAQNIPLDRIEADIASAVPDQEDVVLVYCRSGNRSAQAAQILEDLGYAVVLDAGGIIDYNDTLVEGEEPGESLFPTAP